MLRFLAAVGGFVFFVLIALLLVPLLIPADWIRDRVVAEIETATGRELTIRGDFGLSILPEIALAIDDVEISGPGGEGDFASLGELRVGLALRPLFDRRIEITGLTLVRPAIDLAVDADGRGNWGGDADGATPGDPAPETLPSDDAAGDLAPTEDGLGLAGFSIARLRIVDGRVTYTDARNDDRYEVTGIGLDTALPDLTGPVAATGGLTWNGRAFTLDAEVAAPLALSEGRPSDAVVTIASDGAKLSFTGRLDPAGVAAGTLGLSADALPRLLADLGIAADVPVRQLSASGQISVGDGRLDVTGLDLRADDLAATGEIALDGRSERPRLDARLHLPTLDLDALPRGSGAGGSGSSGSAGSAGSIDLSPLASFDAGVAIGIGRITGAALGAAGPLSDVALTAVVEGGKLDAVVERIAVAGGHLAGRVAAQPADGGARLDGRLEASGFDVAALAALVGQSLPVSGALSADVSFAALGATTGQLQQSLNAAGSVELARGRVDGLGLAEAIGDPAADRLEDVALVARFDSLEAPVTLSGSARWRGTPFDLSLTADPRRFAAAGAVPLGAKLSSRLASLSFDGTVDAGAGRAAGRIDLAAASLEALSDLAGRPSSGLPPGEVRIAGTLAAGADAVSLTDGRFRLAGTDLSGDVAVGLAGRPKLTARLAGEAVDLGVLLAGAAGSGDVPGGSAGAAAPSPGWSDAPLDLGGLASFDADVAIRASEVRFDRITAGPVDLVSRIEAGQLTTTLSDLRLYGGVGSGEVVIGTTDAVPSIKAAFRLSGVDALPLLTDAAGFSRLAGRMEVALDVAASGASQRDLVGALAGTAAFGLTDGAVLGIDIPKMLGAIASSVVQGWGGGGSTPFHSLSASFAIAEGIVRTENLALAGPVVSAAGAGALDLPNRRLAFRITPEMLAAEGRRGVLGFEVPVVIEGPWANPRIYPDISGILNDPAAAYQRLRELGGGFSALSKNPEAVLGQLAEGLLPALGGGAAGGERPALSTGDRDIDALLGGIAGAVVENQQGRDTGGFGGLGGLFGGLFGGNSRPSEPPPSPPAVAELPTAAPEPQTSDPVTEPGAGEPVIPPAPDGPAPEGPLVLGPDDPAALPGDPAPDVPLPRSRPPELPPRDASTVPQPDPDVPIVAPPPVDEPPLPEQSPAPPPEQPLPPENPAPEPAPEAPPPLPEEPPPAEATPLPEAAPADAGASEESPTEAAPTDPLLDLLQQVAPPQP
ncbi:AsmA family protein [Methylobrevis albus]|uniref:AsmA family protein n=1 Tax=Methylobrevis albus TaxID=2793297 RepID=A0A931I085_9HYPH|nr:AsmA family protein [Methylobrevis albus]MBH0237962.1 AsmA family protein [Methylobrevis albus]